jgi:hypothetical protein
MAPRRAPAGLARPCMALAFASLALGCTFPEVTIGDRPGEGGAPPGSGFEAGVADSAFSGGDDGTSIADAPRMPEGAAAVDVGVPDSALDSGGGCNFNGWWANRITIDVTWQPQGLNSVIIQPGSGTITQWVLGKRVQTSAAPTALSDDSVVCGISLPDFQATVFGLAEVYGVRFPTTLFDDGYIPHFTVNGALTPQPTGGLAYSTTPTAVLMGLTMPNPTTDPWPATVPTQYLADMDQDGNPGVTIAVAQGPIEMPTSIVSSYSYIPTGLTPPPLLPAIRASSLYLAIRQVTIASGAVRDCNTITGAVSIQTIQSKPAIDSHILGCTLVDGGSCTTGASSEASFLDNTQPVFTPSTTGKTTFQSVRLANVAAGGATCADVRAALP